MHHSLALVGTLTCNAHATQSSCLLLLRQSSFTGDTSWQCRWRHIITDAFLVVLAACFTAFTAIKVQSAQRDVGGSFWKAMKEHPQLANDWAICIAQWTGDLRVVLLLKEPTQRDVAHASGSCLQAWPCT